MLNDIFISHNSILHSPLKKKIKKNDKWIRLFMNSPELNSYKLKVVIRKYLRIPV